MRIAILYFLLIFNIPFNGVPIGTSSVATLLMLSFLIIRKRILVKHCVPLIPVFFYLLALALYFLVLTIMAGEYDLSFLKLTLKNLLILPIGALCLVIYEFNSSKEGGFNNLLRRLEFAFFAQALIILFSFSFPSFRDFVHSLVVHDYFAQVSSRYGGFRGLGLAYSVTYDLSVSFAIALLIGWYLWFGMKEMSLPKFVSLSCLFIFCILISGRSGIVCIAIFAVFGLCVVSLSLIRGTISKDVLKMFVVCFCIIVSLSVLTFQMFPNVGAFVIKPVELLLSGDVTKVGSLAKTFSNLLLPSDLVGQLFGSGRYTNLSGEWRYYGDTDVGYLRWLHVLGVVGSLIVYGGVIYFSWIIYHNLRLCGRRGLAYIWLMILFAGLTIDLKGQFIFNHFFLCFLWLFYFASTFARSIGVSHVR